MKIRAWFMAVRKLFDAIFFTYKDAYEYAKLVDEWAREVEQKHAEFTGRNEDEMTAQEWMDKHGLKVGDEVRIYRPDREWSEWVNPMESSIGKTLKIVGSTLDCLRLLNGWLYRPCCLEPVPKPAPVYTLDTAAIRKRFSDAVVVGFRGKIHILLLEDDKDFKSGWKAYGLVDGEAWGNPSTDLEDCRGVDWIIRPGDKCEVSDNDFGCYKVGCTFDGFSGFLDFPFRVKHGDRGKDNHSSIRPLPKITPEQKRRQEQIEKIERDIESAQERLAELRQMDK